MISFLKFFENNMYNPLSGPLIDGNTSISWRTVSI